MPTHTTNYNLKKPAQEEFYNVDDFNSNADIIDAELKKNANNLTQVKGDITKHLADLVKHGVYGVATGTNTLVMTLENVSSYPTGMLVAFKNTTANTGAVTLNINGLGAKSIRKANGSTLLSGNLKAGGVYQLRYDGVNFMLLGEGGEYGTAIASDVLAGKTVGTENGLVTGTIPSKSAQTFTPSTTNQTINSGQYLSGVQTILGDVDLIAANILAGKDIFGVEGNLIPLNGEKKWAIVLGAPTVSASSSPYSESRNGGAKRFYGNFDYTGSSYENTGWLVTGLDFIPRYAIVKPTDQVLTVRSNKSPFLGNFIMYSEHGVAVLGHNTTSLLTADVLLIEG